MSGAQNEIILILIIPGLYTNPGIRNATLSKFRVDGHCLRPMSGGLLAAMTTWRGRTGLRRLGGIVALIWLMLNPETERQIEEMIKDSEESDSSGFEFQSEDSRKSDTSDKEEIYRSLTPAMRRALGIKDLDPPRNIGNITMFRPPDYTLEFWERPLREELPVYDNKDKLSPPPPPTGPQFPSFEIGAHLTSFKAGSSKKAGVCRYVLSDYNPFFADVLDKKKTKTVILKHLEVHPLYREVGLASALLDKLVERLTQKYGTDYEIYAELSEPTKWIFAMGSRYWRPAAWRVIRSMILRHSMSVVIFNPSQPSINGLFQHTDLETRDRRNMLPKDGSKFFIRAGIPRISEEVRTKRQNVTVGVDIHKRHLEDIKLGLDGGEFGDLKLYEDDERFDLRTGPNLYDKEGNLKENLVSKLMQGAVVLNTTMDADKEAELREALKRQDLQTERRILTQLDMKNPNMKRVSDLYTRLRIGRSHGPAEDVLKLPKLTPKEKADQVFDLALNLLSVNTSNQGPPEIDTTLNPRPVRRSAPSEGTSEPKPTLSALKTSHMSGEGRRARGEQRRSRRNPSPSTKSLGQKRSSRSANIHDKIEERAKWWTTGESTQEKDA
ncbi:hypothetical protein AAMO2058_000449700 [Amorphochlora amoebiformis]